ncbi:acyltransferase family protein [Hirschia baltica]|uniref:Acyltransferase 3 n=1 Tax=Hirschia baltica (strain ATCC 49814 / DSM 5838 / IFAM 1418) TaxID=582402 RepID=C6XIY4_HIRBI|nr:acyltransferase family protein [Hirschia baltica]ACT59079.1 acyltransferase 3 [Hirschia baltica ATCC 49814]
MMKSPNGLIELEKPGYEPSLDGLRAIAVMAVLLYHLGATGLHGGFIGVDVFYIISGFLITRILLSQFEQAKFDYTEFLVRRCRRLLPALFLTIVLTLIGAFLVMSPKHFSETAESAVYSSVSLANWYFWIDSSYFSAGKHVRPLLHTWSLGVEVQFYLAWPLVMALVSWIFYYSRWTAFFVMVFIGAVSFFASVYVQDGYPSAAFYLSIFRVWQFAAGGCIAILLLLPGKNGDIFISEKLHWLFFVGGIVLLGMSMFLLSSDNYNAIRAVLPTIATCALLIGIRTSASRVLLGSRPLVRLGQTSYSLYLIHWPLIILYRYWAFRPLNAWEMIILAGVSMLLAELMYRLVEERFRLPWAGNQKGEVRLVGFVVSSIVMAIGFSGSLIAYQNGWNWRLSEARQEANLETHLSIHCGANFKSLAETACAFGQPKKDPDIVVIGDSHALEFAKGFEALVQADDLSAVLVRQYGVLPFKGVTTYGGEWKVGDFEENLTRVADVPSQIVVIHARFAQYWWGIDAEGEPPTRIGFQDGSPDGIEPSQHAFRVGLDNTLAHFKNAGSKLVVIGAIPYPGLDSSQCIVRPSYLISEDHSEKSCEGLTRMESKERASAVNRVLKKRVEQEGHLFIDPTSVFCPETQSTCLRMFDGKVIYHDSNHLNGVGASILADYVWAMIKQNFGEPFMASM